MNSKQIIIDKNYNTVVTTEDGNEYLVFADRLHNESLDHWKGWRCAAGAEYLAIDPNFDVYGSMCKNDYLGNLESNFELLKNYTECKLPRCVLCTADLMIDKFKP